MEQLIGPDILAWDSGFVIKEPHSHGYVSWHQDLTYWGLDTDLLVTAWLALSPATVENGTMKMIPGSHIVGKRPHSDTHEKNNLLHKGQTLEGIDDTLAVDIVLEAGQASLHHGWVAHASPPNGSDDRRIGFTVQYAAPSVKQMVGGWDSATLVRGSDTYLHFATEPRPLSDFHPVETAYQREVERLKHAVYDEAD